MRRDIERQPFVLHDLAGRAAEFGGTGARHLTPDPGGRLFVCGCGDGFFAAQAARRYAESLMLDWRPIGALELVLSAPSLQANDRVLAISMSGNVDRTVDAARAVEARGVPLVALVNGRGGRLGEIAPASISLELPEIAPFLCGTASYTATVGALVLIATGAAGAGSPPDLDLAAHAQGEAMSAADRVAAALRHSSVTGIRVLSSGSDLGTAQYGAAKFVELTRIPSWHGDLEEFAHSQYWAMPESDLVVIIAADPTLARYADEACEALAQLGVTTIAIDTLETPVAHAAYRATLPAMETALAPLATAVPLQILAYVLAESTGLDPNARTHLKADERRFRISRLLTRRSLVGTGQ
jgi:glucosamine 6-phosphate synthetase-like amidotransferase/phosphosugar isomerase protein